MGYENLVRRSAMCWLAMFGLFFVPLRALAAGTGPTEERAKEFQDEVWTEWAKQEPPIDEPIFE